MIVNDTVQPNDPKEASVREADLSVKFDTIYQGCCCCEMLNLEQYC